MSKQSDATIKKLLDDAESLWETGHQKTVEADAELLRMIELRIQLDRLQTENFVQSKSNLSAYLDEYFSIAKIALGWLIPGFFATFAFEAQLQNVNFIRQITLVLILFFVATIMLGLKRIKDTSEIEKPVHSARQEMLRELSKILNGLMKRNSKSRTLINQELAKALDQINELQDDDSSQK